MLIKHSTIFIISALSDTHPLTHQMNIFQQQSESSEQSRFYQTMLIETLIIIKVQIKEKCVLKPQETKKPEGPQPAVGCKRSTIEPYQGCGRDGHLFVGLGSSNLQAGTIQGVDLCLFSGGGRGPAAA